MKNSPTYIIKVINTSNKVTEGVIVGHSYVSRFENNYGEKPNIKIISLVPNVTYKQFLGITEKQPFQVVKTIIKSTSNGQKVKDLSLSENGVDVIRKYKSQLEQDIRILYMRDKITQQKMFWCNDYWMTTRKYITQKIITRRKNCLISNHKYIFDGEAKISFNYILGNTEIIICLYTDKNE